jgi:hypothetical protein
MVEKLRIRFTNWDYTRAVDIPEYVIPKLTKPQRRSLTRLKI